MLLVGAIKWQSGDETEVKGCNMIMIRIMMSDKSGDV